MRRAEPRLSGLIVVEPDVILDARGFFLETYSTARHAELGIDMAFVQDKHSRSTRGTIRGLHFQSCPGQDKLVRVASGAAWDVVADIRHSSPTFGQWEGCELDDRSHCQLFVPIGVRTWLLCAELRRRRREQCRSPYASRTERGITWDDPGLAIPWPTRSSAGLRTRPPQRFPFRSDP